MNLDPPFELPDDPAIPAYVRDLYDWLCTVQGQVDIQAAQSSRQAATLSRLKEKLMDAQADINAVVTELNAAADEITARIDELEAQIAAGETLDLTALKAAADRLRDVVPDPTPEP